MDFESALKYIDKFISYEKKINFKYDKNNFNLERFKNFLIRTETDYSKLKFVHIAGSKGKGSVCRILAEYMKNSGYKVGLFTSPHLVDIRERIMINGRMISKKRFSDYVFFLKKCSQEKITYFEFLTAIALKYFVDEKVDYAILETGLGGRLDSTNVVTPKLSILTRMEMEHRGILGNTLEEILNEKIGIVKNKVPVVIGQQKEKVNKLLLKKLAKKDDKYFVEDNCCEFDALDLSSEFFDEARMENGRTVFLALKVLFKKIDKEAFKEVFKNILLFGRFDIREILGKIVVFDVAHTKNSIENLIKGLEKFYKRYDKIFLISLFKGKEVKPILKKISRVAKKIILTSSNHARAYSGKELAEIFKGSYGHKKALYEFVIEENMYEAYKKTFDSLKKNQILVVAGSHFLVGKLMPI